ncbi:ATP-binding protein [Flavitalea sp. BT771]|uniref:ATP-binding protein n=1 Tax=Flavitalea sp. BT771 TaxID=3063329 RepID=UPI0026E12E4F|nr:ATP-binding protein [Flavitalea sp. BT771]MDO6433977.1 ATP-binding protein [Flavitalea sp. BT771]MDV6222877.1 ATP-binding protein [Flavitalea sp. BT771]
MDIKRAIQRKLLRWKQSPERKPLILQGARQVGKTWLLKHFGTSEFDNVAYFNFEEQPDLKQFFENTKDVRRILQNLSLVHGQPIVPQRTLIIFDEIQECNDALNALKYFSENAPEYAVAGAGSLLGVSMSKGNSFPVGKVDFLHLNPVCFAEFLSAADPELFSFLESIDRIEPLPDIFFHPLVDKLKMFFISGGMPEAVVALLEKQNIERTQQVLQNVLNAYALDFSKHAEKKEIPKLNYLWSSIPSQLARDNKKFLYQAVKPGARSREYEDALLWLSHAGLVHRIFRISKPGLPLSAYDDLSAFKLYLLDVGLLRRLSFLDPIAIREGNRLFTEFKGALSENYILQHLIAHFEGIPRYWTSGNQAEVDFLIQIKNDIIPIEVKSDESIHSKSLTLYNGLYHPPLRIRYSLKNLKKDDGLLNIPLFMVDYTEKLLRLS